MAHRSRQCPPWAKQTPLHLIALGSQPQPWNRLRLRLAWIVFTDQMGNFVMVDPERPRPLGVANQKQRPPSIYFAATGEEFEACAEAMLPVLEANLVAGRRQAALIERVAEIRERLAGFRKPERLPKVA